jgi:hypothetical protein
MGEEDAGGEAIAGATEVGRDLGPPKEKERLRSPKLVGLCWDWVNGGRPLSISSFMMEVLRE